MRREFLKTLLALAPLASLAATACDRSPYHLRAWLVQGTVYDDATRLPLSSAEVRLVERGRPSAVRVTRTDATGHFRFSDHWGSSYDYEVHVTRAGYHRYELDLDSVCFGHDLLTLRLRPLP